MKIVINKCFGGFGLSEEGARTYWERKGKQVFVDGRGLFKSFFDAPVPDEFSASKGEFFMDRDHPEYQNYNKWYSEHALSEHNIKRDDPDLVFTVETLGTRANGICADLAVVEIPDGIDWEISEYDGNERVAERHRCWY